jgi:uncharacterized membrane protein
MRDTLIAAVGDGMHRGFRDDGIHPFFMLLCLIALGAVIGVVIGLIRRRADPPAAPASNAAPHAAQVMAPVSPTANAEVILAERLARSEISPDDYRTMLAALRDPGPVT